MSILKNVANASRGRIEASKKVGDNKLTGAIDTKNEAIEIGIDFKVGGLGITTDYGGGIKVSIAGQSITWGREGGKIYYNVFGFEVIVEARNCVVTETKKIAGIVVASHTYPDPGCKLPEPPQPPEPPVPTPNPDSGIDLPSTEEIGWVVFNMRELYYLTYSQIPNYDNTTIRTASNIKEKDRIVSSLPFKLVSTKNRYNSLDYTIEQGTAIHLFQTYTTTGTFGNMSISACQKYPPYTYNFDFVAAFYGKVGTIKQFIELNKLNTNAAIADRLANSIHTSRSFFFYIPILFIPLNPPNPKTPKPFLPTGNKPPMNQDCCDEILDILEEFRDVFLPKEILKTKGANKGRLLEKQTTPLESGKKRAKLKDKAFTNYPAAIDGILSELEAFEKILHSDFLIEKKFPIPLNLLIPGADGKVEAETFYHLIKHLFQSLAHGTIINPVVTIQDTDSAKEGYQTLTTQYMSATGWAEAVTKMLYEIVDDGNVATNMDIRTGVTVTQLLVAVADLSARVDCIIDAIGVTTIRKKGEIETSYNLVLDKEDKTKGKGFDPKKSNQKLDLNSDMETEKLLPHLLKSRVNPIVIESVHPKASSLFEMLQDLKKKE